jgi:hypothetical protein
MSLPCSGNLHKAQREEVAMKKELILLALRFALLIAPIGVMYLVG